MSPDITVVACLTAPGSSALATVGVAGPNAWEVVRPFFQPRGRRVPRLGQEDQHWLGQFVSGDMKDDVVLTLTGTSPRQRVELHCHGGRTVLRWVLDSLIAAGAVEVSWQTWIEYTAARRIHAFTEYALTQAITLRTASLLLEQHNGLLESRLEQMVDAPSDEALRLADELLAWSDFAQHLTQPWRVVIAGAPNAGKSSLINALLGYQRAITADQPGTTRDVLSARTALDGWPVELIDTAGLRTPTDAIEAQGIALATATFKEADLVLWLADLTNPIFPDRPLASRRHLLVGNKVDLVSPVPVWAACAVSALTGQGLPELIQRLLMELIPVLPAPGTALPVHPALVRSLKTFRDALHEQKKAHLARAELRQWLAPAFRP